MKNFAAVVFASLICGATFVLPAFAGEGAIKIATMDLKKVLEVSRVGQVAQATVKQKYEEYQAKLSKKEEVLLALKDDIEKKRTVWSEDVRNQKEREFKRGVQDLDEESKYANNDMKDFEKKQIEPLLKELDGIIGEYGKAQGLAVILDTTRGVVYQDEALDISAKIAAELDKRHVDSEAKPEAADAKAEAKPAAAKVAAKANKTDAKR
ncbi:MAG: OmpH family outer membrane protein [Desulfobulbaceae bacterium]|nr:OmpH family outer membrane protein [Desulfobulbaceae bacterium]